ncbi:glycoside hydrolase family 108 protein [Pararhodospirillum photometricum]|uniref:Uncharacterized protein n=1 Tax=Pararhodospirillum photometricum DSM 122 TaxID=1150469 RepID=H6SQM6_PARPM|nr:glycosyl hydrolase 108 family protein [Pararhodospirillum photometricum]CCG07341.1 Putative uncharacterized protein [Pararhodospirillum photometricum DSM 122]
MADDQVWAAALAAVLAHEGGYVNDPRDPGGATKWGVSLRWLRALEGGAGDTDGDGDVDADDVKALTPTQAGALYYKEWWVPLRCAAMPPPIAIKLFDTAVNVGPRPAITILQTALNVTGGLPPVAVDGKVGPETLGKAQGILPIRIADVVADMCVAQEAYYRTLVARIPARAVYLIGWTRRARWRP